MKQMICQNIQLVFILCLQFTNLELDDDMLSTASHPGEKLFRRIKKLCHRVATQSKAAFGPTVRRSMILMIIINFAIQFG
jgi:VNT family MFS transporter (synaptic vesicle glycoprotein 2)